MTNKRVYLLARRANRQTGGQQEATSNLQQKRHSMFEQTSPQGHGIRFNGSQPISYTYLGNSKAMREKIKHLAPPPSLNSPRPCTPILVPPIPPKNDMDLLEMMSQNQSLMLQNTKRVLSQVNRHERNQLTREQRALERMEQYRCDWDEYKLKMKGRGIRNICADKIKEKSTEGFNPTKKFQSFRDDNLSNFWQLSLRNGDPRVYCHLEGIPYPIIVQNMLLDKSKRAMNQNMPSIEPMKRKKLQDMSLNGRSKLRDELSASSSPIRCERQQNPQEQQIVAEQWQRRRILQKGLNTIKMGSF